MHPLPIWLRYFSILSISAVISFLLVQTAHHATEAEPIFNIEGKRSVAVGDTICLPQAQSGFHFTLMLVMSTKCPYSQAMAPLAQKMSQYAATHGIDTVIITETDASAVWPHLLQAPSVTTLISAAPRIGYSSIPVIALLDEKRRVLAHKISYSYRDNNEEILRGIFSRDAKYSQEVRDVTDHSGRSGPPGPQVVRLTQYIPRESLIQERMADFKDLMTVEDLALRAPYEIDTQQPVVLDCSVVAGRECEVSTRTLQNLSFLVAYTINGWEGKTLTSKCVEDALGP